jgi:hypothetical protein
MKHVTPEIHTAVIRSDLPFGSICEFFTDFELLDLRR